MTHEYDIHIKGGTIVDGTRMPKFKGDLWIKDGKVAKIGGRTDATSKQTIDATDCIVAPGFVDLHTHYDAQIRWDPWCTTSGWHGTTSVVLGNCGFGFAPVKPESRERSMLTMVRTEAIPLACLKEGMTWDWETVPEYLDSLDRAPKGVNCIQYMPLASLMIYVMGIDAAKTRPATEQERAEMRRLLHEGMDAGLLGFSYQRLGENSQQADYDGTPMCTDTMADEDILNLCRVLRERDEGVIQLAQSTDVVDMTKDLAFVEKVAEVSGRPVIYNVISTTLRNPEIHRRLLRWLDDCNARGLRIFGQGVTIRSSFAIKFSDWNMYDRDPAWREITTGTHEEKLRKMADPALREKVKYAQDNIDDNNRAFQAGVGGHPKDFIIGDLGNAMHLSHLVGKVVDVAAREEGKHYLDLMFDLALETNLEAEFLPQNKGQNAEYMAELINSSPYTFPGVSDGGAHTKFYSGGSYTTDFLRWLVRDEKRVTLEEAHYRLSALPAHAAGFSDRGILRVGLPADVVVYNMDELDVTPDFIGEIVHDLPGGEWRRIQHAKGYVATIVNGVQTFAGQQCTGATPAVLLRHGQG